MSRQRSTATAADEIDAHAVDEAIHYYHRAAGELWKFCFARGGGSHAEFIAGLLDRMTADAETIDWWERHTAPTPVITTLTRPARPLTVPVMLVTDRSRASRRSL